MLDRAVLTNEQLLEEPLVDLSPNVVGGMGVGRLASTGRMEGSFQGDGDVLVGGLGCGDLQIGLLEFTGEAVHLGNQEVLRDGAGVVGLEKLVAFGFDALFALGGVGETAAGFGLLAGEFGCNRPLDLSGIAEIHLQVTVEAHNGLFNAHHPHSSANAVVLFGLAFDAPVVWIDAAVAFLFGIDQPSAAGRAVDGAA